MAKQPRGELVILTQGFDYAPLEAQVAEQVRSSAEKIRCTVQKTIEDIIVVGRELLAVKEALTLGAVRGGRLAIKFRGHRPARQMGASQMGVRTIEVNGACPPGE